MPLSETVTAFLEASAPGAAALPDALRAWLATRLREPLPSDVWEGVDAAPAFDRAGACRRRRGPGTGERARSRGAARRSWARRRSSPSRRPVPPSSDAGCKRWDLGDLPETLTRERGSQRITGYPALVDDEDSVSVALLDTRAAARGVDARRCRPADRLRTARCARSLRKAGSRVHAARAPAAHDDSDGCAAGRCARRHRAIVRLSAMIRCRARSRRSLRK